LCGHRKSDSIPL